VQSLNYYMNYAVLTEAIVVVLNFTNTSHFIIFHSLFLSLFSFLVVGVAYS
jgi:hypothetical protein